MENIIIREYQPMDKNLLIGLFNEFGKYLETLDSNSLKLLRVKDDYGEQFFSKMKREIDDNEGVIYVVEKGGKLVGFSSGIVNNIGNDPIDDCKPHVTGRLTELFISEKFRKKGLGTKLLNEMMKFFKKNNCYKVNVEVFAPNILAYKYYKTQGFIDRNFDLVKVL